MYQWIIRNKQETCIYNYFMSENYYHSEEDIYERFKSADDEVWLYFEIIEPFLKSKLPKFLYNDYKYKQKVSKL